MEPAFGAIRQLTFGPYNHDLDNNQNFSTDGQWLLYDTRNPGIDLSRTIEKVNITTGDVVVLYNTENGPKGQVNGAGAGSFSPVDNRVAFIHGPFRNSGLPYDFTFRRGGLISGKHGLGFGFADARDVTAPFTPGALRGGTHRHEWDGTGKYLGYTYNDELMKRLGTDLRTIGVTQLGLPVEVANADPGKFEGNGEGFSVLVVRVLPDPKPGTDEIQRAAQDSWVGNNGYLLSDGSMQRARAFVGTLRSVSGLLVDELFIVDIPDDLTQVGEWGPLEGTETSFPAPPKGSLQRRLTWTERNPYPGVVGTCWSSPDGNWITFLAKDKHNISQIFAIHPNSKGESTSLLQVTDIQGGVVWAPRWSSDGKFLASVTVQGGLFVCQAPSNETALPQTEIQYLTQAGHSEFPPTKPVWSPDGKQIAFNQVVKDDKGEHLQVFLVSIQ